MLLSHFLPILCYGADLDSVVKASEAYPKIKQSQNEEILRSGLNLEKAMEKCREEKSKTLEESGLIDLHPDPGMQCCDIVTLCLLSLFQKSSRDHLEESFLKLLFFMSKKSNPYIGILTKGKDLAEADLETFKNLLQEFYKPDELNGIKSNAIKYLTTKHCCDYLKKFSLIKGPEPFLEGKTGSQLKRNNAPVTTHRGVVSTLLSSQDSICIVFYHKGGVVRVIPPKETTEITLGIHINILTDDSIEMIPLMPVELIKKFVYISALSGDCADIKEAMRLIKDSIKKEDGLSKILDEKETELKEVEAELSEILGKKEFAPELFNSLRSTHVSCMLPKEIYKTMEERTCF